MEGLFRGKRIDNKEWVHGHYIIYREKSNPQLEIHSIYSGLSHEAPEVVFQETVGRYSGKKDNQDREIFEHDIFEEVKHENDDIGRYYVCTWVDEWSRFVWLSISDFWDYQDNGVKHIENIPMINTFGLNIEHMSYVGNIFDNIDF